MKNLIICIILFCGLINLEAQEVARKVSVIVSIPPQLEFASSVGREKIEVTVMVPAWASPHTYEPTPSQMKLLSSADVYFKIGSGIEFELLWLPKLQKTNKRMKIIDGSIGIELIDSEEHTHTISKTQARKDPHIWLSPINAISIVKNFANELSQIDQANSNFYKENADNYISRLTKLDKKIRSGLQGISGSKFFVFHPSWGYFAKEYKLEQVSIERDGKEPKARDLINLAKLAKENRVKVVFSSPNSNPKSAEIFANEVNARLLLINPHESTYIELIDKMAKKLKEASR